MVVLCKIAMSRPRTYTSRQIERARKKARKGGWVLKKQSGTAYRAVRAKKSTSTRRRTTRRTTRRRGAASMAEQAYRDAATLRQFNGNAYRKHTASTTKNEAVREAARLRRRSGTNARVVKNRMNGRDVWVVYRFG